MNYRHAFHAGNFVDVHKHVVLALILTHLREKPAAFRVLDTHAGAGLYDLGAAEAAQTGEWRQGIGRLWGTRFGADVEDLLAPYRNAVARFNPGGALAAYPGSPVLARSFLREQDRLLACETLPEAHRALAGHFGRDPHAKALARDGWTGLRAYLPPKERRGLVLVDPPYEDPQELARAADGLASAHARWATGIFVLWYPLSTRTRASVLAERLTQTRIPKILRTELLVGNPRAGESLVGSGLLVINPPWRLHAQLSLLLPPLAEALARPERGAVRLDWIAR